MWDRTSQTLTNDFTVHLSCILKNALKARKTYDRTALSRIHKETTCKELRERASHISLQAVHLQRKNGWWKIKVKQSNWWVISSAQRPHVNLSRRYLHDAKSCRWKEGGRGLAKSLATAANRYTVGGQQQVQKASSAGLTREKYLKAAKLSYLL